MLKKALVINQDNRSSIQQILQHRYFSQDESDDQYALIFEKWLETRKPELEKLIKKEKELKRKEEEELARVPEDFKEQFKKLSSRDKESFFDLTEAEKKEYYSMSADQKKYFLGFTPEERAKLMEEKDEKVREQERRRIKVFKELNDEQLEFFKMVKTIVEIPVDEEILPKDSLRHITIK